MSDFTNRYNRATSLYDSGEINEEQFFGIIAGLVALNKAFEEKPKMNVQDALKYVDEIKLMIEKLEKDLK